MTTLLLDLDTWDLVVDANNNIAVADDPYAMAQDVSSALLLYAGELFYNKSKGVPYYRDILGKPFDYDILNDAYVLAAQTVKGVTSAQCEIFEFSSRLLSGRILLSSGAIIGFNNGTPTVLGV